MDLRKKFKGVLEVASGYVTVTDPGYDADEDCFIQVTVKNGSYLCYTYEAEKTDWIQRMCLMDQEDNFSESDWEMIGYLPVDAGLMSICDGQKPDYTDAEWETFCDMLSDNIFYHKGKKMFVSPSGEGDGFYPVYAVMDKDRNAIAIEIRFRDMWINRQDGTVLYDFF